MRSRLRSPETNKPLTLIRKIRLTLPRAEVGGSGWGWNGQEKWSAGKSTLFGGNWKARDTVGLAVWVPTEAYRVGGGISVSVNGSFDPPHGAMIPADGLADARAVGVFAAIISSSGPIPLHACLPEGPYCYIGSE